MSVHTRSTELGWMSYVVFMTTPYAVPVATAALSTIEAGYSPIHCHVKNVSQRGFLTQARFFCQVAHQLDLFGDQVVYLGKPDHRSRRGTYLVKRDGSVEHLGRLQSVKRDDAICTSTWLFRPDQGTYYTTFRVAGDGASFTDEAFSRMVLRSMSHKPFSLAAE